MADDVERLVLQMSADLRNFDRQLARSRQITERRMAEVEAAARKSDKNLNRMMDKMGTDMVSSLRSSLAGLAPTLAAAFSAQQVVAYADAWTNGRNALAAAGVATTDLAARQEELVAVANDSRTGTAETIALYTRLSIATQELGLAQGDTLRLTELLNKSFQASGASTQEAASAALQLSQALASGTLQGDELRSLRENAPQLAQVIAQSMGVGIGALKELGAEGKITGQVVAQAILGAGDQIEAKFNATQVTVSQSLTILNNELGKFIGQTDSAGSASARMAEAIVALSKNLDAVVTAAGVAVTIVGTRWVIAQTTAAAATATHTAAQIALIAAISGTSRAALASTVALRGLGAAALFFVTNPIGIAITAVSVALAAVALKGQDANQRVEELRTTMGGARDAMEHFEEAAKAAANATAENAEQMRQSAEAARIDALFRLENARAIRVQTAALAEQRAREARVADEQAASIGTPYPGLMGGQAVGASQRAKQAREEADAARAAERQAQREYDRIIGNMQSGAYRTRPGPAPATKATSGRTTSGPSEADLAAQREMLALQGQVELFRAQGRSADADAAQRQIDVLNLTRQYQDAGIEDAKARAEALVNGVANAEAAERGRAWAIERSNALMDAATEGMRIQNDILVDRLRMDAELAQLSGDPHRIEQAERALYIEERTNELLAQRPGLISEADARRQAGGEFDALASADRQGALRDMFRTSFRDGIQAAIDGDVGGLFTSLADRFTDRLLDNLADDLFDLVDNAMGGGKGDGKAGWIESLAGWVFGGKFANGGMIRGPGGPKSDSVPILASNGEMIMTAAAAKSFGPLLHAMNAGKLKGYAAGGVIATNEAGPAEGFVPA